MTLEAEVQGSAAVASTTAYAVQPMHGLILIVVRCRFMMILMQRKSWAKFIA